LPPETPKKLKRLTVELHPDLHREFMAWTRKNGHVARTFLETLILTALSQSGDFSDDEVAQLHKYALGPRRGE